ncbi:hypothetical protein ACHAXR_001296, partial [Thalassiosira sp. AJA248-18]
EDNEEEEVKIEETERKQDDEIKEEVLVFELTDETKEEATGLAESKKESTAEPLLSLLPVFLHALVIQWTLALAISMAFGFDWWLSHLGPKDGEGIVESQRAYCVTLALWLGTIVCYAVAFGAHSRAGWFFTGTALAVSSFSTKLMTGEETPVPSLPIYSFSGFDINVPDVLVVLCILGFAAVLKQPVVAQEPQEVANEEPEKDDAPQVVEPEEEKKEDEVATPEASGPRSLIGQRVAVDEFLGTVKDYDSETREWLVQYDNEFQEEVELNRVQLGSAFKGYSKHLSDNLKAMWRAGEL